MVLSVVSVTVRANHINYTLSNDVLVFGQERLRVFFELYGFENIHNYPHPQIDPEFYTLIEEYRLSEPDFIPIYEGWIRDLTEEGVEPNPGMMNPGLRILHTDDYYGMFMSKVPLYPCLSHEELKVLAYSFNTEEELEGFVACQKKRYIFDGHVSSIRNGNCDPIGEFIPMTEGNVKEVMMVFDTIQRNRRTQKLKEVNRVEIAVFAESSPVVETIKEVPAGSTSATPELAEIEVSSSYSTKVYDLGLIISSISSHEVLVFPGDGAGVGACAAKQQSRRFYSSDGSQVMIDLAEKFGNLVRLETFKETLAQNGIFIISNLCNIVPDVVSQLIDKGKRFLVYEEDDYFIGMEKLSMVTTNWGHKLYSYDMKGYTCPGILSSKYKPLVYRRYNFDTIARFKNYVFLGKDTIEFIEFLDYLHPGEKYNRQYIGEDAIAINQKYNNKGGLTDDPKLIVVGKDTRLLDMLFKPGDSVYNVIIDHEMSEKYFKHVIPFIGSTTMEELNKLGFPKFDTYPNCKVAHGKIYALGSPDNFKRSSPIIFRGDVKDYFSNQGYPITQYMDIQYIGDFTIGKFRQNGTVKLSCKSYHSFRYPGCVSCHYHLISILSEFPDMKVSVIDLRHSLIGLLPRVVSRRMVKQLYSNEVVEEMDEYLDIMACCPGVLSYRNEWFMIEGNRMEICHSDMADLNDKAILEGVSIKKLLSNMFGVEVLWMKVPAHRIMTKPYVYTRMIDGDHRMFVSVKMYRKFMSDQRLLSLCGSTPNMGQDVADDFCIYMGGDWYWTMFYYGK